MTTPQTSPQIQQNTESPESPKTQKGLIKIAAALAALSIIAIIISTAALQKAGKFEKNLAQQMHQAAQTVQSAQEIARQAHQKAERATLQLENLQAHFIELGGWRAQLQELIHTVARARDENLAVELDTALRLAQDQAQWSGSATPLIAALKTAERRLQRSSDPRLLQVTRAVEQDINQLKTADLTDTASALAKIKMLAAQIDKTPLINQVSINQIPTQTHPQTPPNQAKEETQNQEEIGVIEKLYTQMKSAALETIKIHKIQNQSAALASPEQAFFIKENLKLALQSSRLAILAGQYEAARADLAQVASGIKTWFDPAAKNTQTAAGQVQEIQEMLKDASTPKLQFTLTALDAALDAAAQNEAATEKEEQTNTPASQESEEQNSKE